MAQQVTMIQQYGPLVRNLPAMMKLYSQLSKSDDTETEANEESEKQSVSEESSEKKRDWNKTSDGNKNQNQKVLLSQKKSKTTDNKEQELKHLPRRKGSCLSCSEKNIRQFKTEIIYLTFFDILSEIGYNEIRRMQE